jgi:tetratricopeptide (TPR) repeat protein
MIISPVMKFIVDKAGGYPSPTESEKLSRTIEKFRKILKNLTGTFNIAETKFGLADMMVGRNGPGDHAEAMRLYNYILEIAPTSYLRARALVGKAELFIGSNDPKELKEAISLCEKATEILKDDLSDFFTAKAFVVQAEILAKLGPDGRNKAVKLLQKVYKNKHATGYFRARAMIGASEMPLYKPKPKNIGTYVSLCEQASKLLEDRPKDYFAVKAKIVESELLIRRGGKGDLAKANSLCTKVLALKPTEKGLVARAKLNLAEVSRHPKTEKLTKEVLEMEGIDPYLIEKAKTIEASARKSGKRGYLKWMHPMKKKLALRISLKITPLQPERACSRSRSAS